MPSNYAVINEDEMTYLEGGSTYRGLQAWREISVILGSAFSWACSFYILANAAAGFAATGIGVVLSVLSAAGATASLISAIWQCTNAVAAIYYTMRNGGFRHESTGFWVWSWSVVKPL